MNANILVVEDDPALRCALTASLQVGGYKTSSADCAEAALSMMNNGQLPDLVITDIQMGAMSGIDLLKNLRRHHSQLPVILMTAYGDVSDAVNAMRLGACDYLQKPFEAGRLTELINQYLPQNISSKVIMEDPESKKIFDFAKKIAKTNSNIILSGASGSGKEIMSRFIHENSPRKEQPFVAINCAAIPENMLEAILFGYEKGAFTGAHQATQGKFERAQGGTLLLDEISEMEISLQAKLLRVIQEKEVERLGGKKTIKLDVRVIATTNRNLKQEVIDKKFREDLYYRLSVFPIHCLALKERPKDILPLAESMLKNNQHAKMRGGLKFSEQAKLKLLTYDWPGNVRELDNLIQRVAVLSIEQIVQPEDIDFESDNFNQASPLSNENTNGALNESESQLGNDMQHHEFQLIVDALNKFNGKKKNVAEGLGISPRTLRYKLAKMRELGYLIPAKGVLE